MAEYNIHHHVWKLMQLLDVRTDRGDMETAIAERLLESKTLQGNRKSSASTKFVKKLNNLSKGEFKEKYEELKAANIMEVDPLVQLLARISESEDVRNFIKLQKIFKEKTRSASVGQKSETPNEKRATSSSVESVNRPSKRDASSTKSDRKVDFSCLTYDFSPFDWPSDAIVPPLSSMSITDQESALIDDLLYVLVGIEGRYIRRTVISEKKFRLVVDDGTDKLLKTLVERIIIICPLYSGVIFFIEHHDFGLVNQALIAFMRGIIHDYFLLITQLEHQHRQGDMTLQKMWFFLRDVHSDLEILKQVSYKIRQGKCIGGAVLSILHEKTVSHTGNIRASQFCMKMTSTACEPYFNILERWISEGVICDEYKEFFIEDTETELGEDLCSESNDDSYWESRYEVVSNRMPIFLSRFADKIMKTGKYLTVIRECGKVIGESPECEPLQYTIEDRVYAERIDTAYNYASKKLLHMLINESNLIAHLNSVKHYFFMDKGDFLVLFMDMAADELKKDIDDIVPTRLESLLELAVRTSVMSTDPHADFLGIELLNDSVLFQLSQILSHGSASFLDNSDKQMEYPESLKGYEALAFKYKVEWPLSLILNQRNIACYQMLFRHLFYCKWVERQLGITWKENKISKRFALKTMKSYAEAFGLRQKMLNYVQNLEYYMMVEVIEPNFHTFLQKVNSKVTSVDDMINEHTIFMEGCLQDCMLTQKVALQLMVKLLNLCMDFASFMHTNHQLSAQFELQGASEQIRKAYEFKPIKEDEQSEVLPSFEQRINQLHTEFNDNLQQLLNEIISQQNDHYTGKMLHILSRLDFNEYYGKMNNGYSCPDQ
ncbi:gamma-tubulin complex component 2 [Tetranychus urticae]|nr:gamma-tubulin complex component 2 [Tetranychus urticae]